jgi:hypothetical protein
MFNTLVPLLFYFVKWTLPLHLPAFGANRAASTPHGKHQTTGVPAFQARTSRFPEA